MSTDTNEMKKRSFFDRLIGPPIETADAPHQAIGKVPALAVFASDALSSVAYATEEILVILAMAGSMYFGLSIPIALSIAVLLVILTVSYRQTIFAYPGGGGAYIVARDNLGEMAALTAGSALMTDYILTVAVSISSGVAQIVSAFPSLTHVKIEIALVLILVMTIVNLRGVKESSTAFAIPTYFFLASAFLMLATGLWRWASGNLGVVAGVEVAQNLTQSITVFLILRAFSSGCTALTGVEAISNGISAFKEPKAKNAAATMTAMSAILMTMFVGITLLAHQVEAMPSESETVISQIARTVFGSGPMYLVMVVATTTILIMAANTSFADFPRLAALIASDGFLPRQLTYRGSRLVFSWGIMGLAGFASLLVVIFNASVSALIPLYAVGVFLSFTISQAGMVVRWQKIGKLKEAEEIESRGSKLVYDKQWRLRQLVNIVGALATAAVTLIFAVTKFSQGAWFILLLIPTQIWAFVGIHRHYQRVAEQLSLGDLEIKPRPSAMYTLLLVDNIHAGTIRLVNFAQSLGAPWKAIHVSVDPERRAELEEKWDERIGFGELIFLESPYRSITVPLREYIRELHEENPTAFIHLLAGQLAMPSVWGQTLHRNTNLLIDLVLRDMERVVVTSVPYQIGLRDEYARRLEMEGLKQKEEDLPESEQ